MADEIIKQQPILQQHIQIPIEALRRINQLEIQLVESYKLIEQIMEQLIEGFAILAMFDPQVRKENTRMSDLLDEWRKMQNDRRNKQTQ